MKKREKCRRRRREKDRERKSRRKPSERGFSPIYFLMPGRYKYVYMVSISELLEIEFGMHRKIKEREGEREREGWKFM